MCFMSVLITHDAVAPIDKHWPDAPQHPQDLDLHPVPRTQSEVRPWLHDMCRDTPMQQDYT